MTTHDSSISKFFEKTREQRLEIIKNFASLTDEELKSLNLPDGGITFEKADKMIENTFGTFALPLGIATNFRINEKDYLVPMVIEEPSVVAAASKAAKLARPKGGFTVTAVESYSIGQIQVLDITNVDSAISKIQENSTKILELANSKSNTLSKMGKGAKKITTKKIDTDFNPMLIVELLIDVGDAMGANVTNTMCEGVAPLIEKLTSGKTLLKILSNYSTRRMVKATAVFDVESVGGPDIVDNMIHAYQFAKHDVYRAVTHNKGIMNGITSVANATGQDSRAIEAAAHAYASSSSDPSHTGQYRSLSDWTKDSNGNLVGTLEIPLAVGIIGGIINVHPIAKICTKILRVESAKELSCVIAATGLAQNFSAMRALVTDGIQKGHMRLHARNLASAAGATPQQIDIIISQMIQEKNISYNRAKQLVLEKI